MLCKRFIRGKSTADRQMAFESMQILLRDSKGNLSLSASIWMEYANSTLQFLQDQDEKGIGKVGSPQETCFEALISCWECVITMASSTDVQVLVPSVQYFVF